MYTFQTLTSRFKLQCTISFLLVFLLAVFMAASPRTFLSGRIYIAFMSTIPTFAIMALAMTMVIIAGEIDLCFPSTMAISGYMFSTVYLTTGSGFLSLLAAWLTGMVVGYGNGLLVVKIGVPSISGEA